MGSNKGNVTCWIQIGIFPTPLYPRMRHLLNLGLELSPPLPPCGAPLLTFVQWRFLMFLRILRFFHSLQIYSLQSIVHAWVLQSMVYSLQSIVIVCSLQSVLWSIVYNPYTQSIVCSMRSQSIVYSLQLWSWSVVYSLYYSL